MNELRSMVSVAAVKEMCTARTVGASAQSAAKGMTVGSMSDVESVALLNPGALGVFQTVFYRAAGPFCIRL